MLRSFVTIGTCVILVVSMLFYHQNYVSYLLKLRFLFFHVTDILFTAMFSKGVKLPKRQIHGFLWESIFKSKNV